jgi:hypothetical protein
MPEEAGLDIDYDAELARLQGQVAEVQLPPAAGIEVAEGKVVTSDRTVEFAGERFRIADKVGALPLLKFSMYADMSINDPRAMAAMYAMLRDCIHPGTPGCGECPACEADDEMSCASWDPGDWERFERHAMDTRADAEELLDVITKTMELISGRPTEPPPGSSPGRRATRAGSTARSSGRRGRGSRR